MSTTAIVSFVFVDFENVPHVDFSTLQEHRVKVTLLIGTKNKLTGDQVEQISRLPFEFRVIKVGVTRKNALDFALAFYLGETVSRNPDGRFYIVSRDKNDFDPLVSHLKANHVRISRHDSIAELPLHTPRRTKPVSLFPVPQGPATIKTTTTPGEEAVRNTTGPVRDSSADRLEDLVATLANPSKPRPRTRVRLLAHIKTFFGGKMAATEQEKAFAALIARKVVSENIAGKLSYSR